jgi:ABC-type glycerol-3-phosphate transport system substrate-binding protein
MRCKKTVAKMAAAGAVAAAAAAAAAEAEVEAAVFWQSPSAHELSPV